MYMAMCVNANTRPIFLCDKSLPEDGLFKLKHVQECKPQNSTTYILSVTELQLVGIIYNKCHLFFLKLKFSNSLMIAQQNITF